MMRVSLRVTPMSVTLVLPAFRAFILLLSLPFFGPRERGFVFLAQPALALVVLVVAYLGTSAGQIDQLARMRPETPGPLIAVFVALTILSQAPQAATGWLVEVGGPTAPRGAGAALAIMVLMTLAMAVLHRPALRRRHDR
jgi:hypothetical protein